MYKRMVLGLVVLLALILTACSGGLVNQTGASVGSGDHSVRILNNSGLRICFLYVSPSRSSEWGPDLLTETGVLDTNGDFTVRLAEAGDYNLKVVLEATNGRCDGTGEQLTNMRVAVDGEVTWKI